MFEDNPGKPEEIAVPGALVEQVRQALEHLYDYPYLERHSLALEDKSLIDRSAETAGQRLRRELMSAIETLSPGPSVPFRSPSARLYNLLHMHYVEGITIHEAAHELFISLRQAYRDLRRGEESVAAVLWARRSASVPQEAESAQISSVQTEVDRLETHSRPTDMRPLIQYAEKAVGRLAQQRAVDFQSEAPAEPVIVATDPVVAQQVLVNLLSYAVQQSQPGTLALILATDKGQVSCTLRYRVDPGATNVPVIHAVVAQLADRLGWRLKQEDQLGNARTVTLFMATSDRTILVIDDNAGLVELLERYLAGTSCRVVAAKSGQEGLQLAQELLPNAILLDVMMPGMDGWELLQILRTRQQTANLPVIICSVFNDPELALSLGASLFLPKPISRDSVLNALRQVSVV
jgi:CheY-like chemotaxis protein